MGPLVSQTRTTAAHYCLHSHIVGSSAKSLLWSLSPTVCCKSFIQSAGQATEVLPDPSLEGGEGKGGV